MSEDLEYNASNRADTLLSLNRPESALKEASQGLANNPENYYLHCVMSRAFIMMENYIQAETSIKTAIHLQPDEPFGYYICSLIKHHQLNFDDELRMAQRAVELDSEDIDYLSRLSYAYMQSGMIKKAKQCCEQVIAINSDCNEAHSLLGNIHLKLENWQEAEKNYRKLLRNNPEDFDIINNLAICLREQKKEEEAIELLYEALKHDPLDKTYQKNLFDFIKTYLDKNTITGKRSTSLNKLPPAIKIFYQDRQQRASIFERYSNLIMAGFWILVLITFSLISELMK